MKLLSWNVNSLKVRGPQLLQVIANHDPDLIALQELKQEEEAIDFSAPGYELISLGQKTYNGVALLSRRPLTHIQRNLPNWDDPQARLLAASCGDLRIVCVYVPNGQELDSDKYFYKLQWLAAARDFLAAELQRWPRLVLLGDFNIVPGAGDMVDGERRAGQIFTSEPERRFLHELAALGLRDSFRAFYPEHQPYRWGDYGAMNLAAADYQSRWEPLRGRAQEPTLPFSWWDYRHGAFTKNRGMRIDLILASEALELRRAGIDLLPRTWERPSDHCPVWLELKA